MAKIPVSNPVSEAIDHLGGDKAVAKRAGLKTSWAVTKWRTKLPALRTIWLAKETGFIYTPHILNPVIYPNPQDGLPTKKARP